MRTYPILRLTIPLAAGIFFADAFPVSFGWLPFIGLVALLLVLGVVARSSSYRFRWLFGAGVACFMFLTGCILSEYARQQVEVDWTEEHRVYTGIVQSTPVEKPKSIQCRVKVAKWEVLLYLQKDSAASSVRMGEELKFQARIQSPANRDSLSSFDYARYLLHQGISGSAYVPAGYWKKTERPPRLTLKQRAIQVRERIVACYREWGIGERQLPVFAALTVGHKGELDKETRNAYSVAGIAHVLALSGLHIGIIWGLLEIVLKPLAIRRLRWLKWLLSTTFLWAFAFVAGLEASVVRAVVMCMLMGLGKLAGAKPLSLNTLAIAAFFMLLYRPFYLFDVGFQLSFVAVASILLLYPVLSGCLSVKNRMLRYGWNVIVVSVSAQLGTAPLVMYYFSNFSVYFLLANLMVVLLVPLIIYGCFVLFVVSPVGWLREGVAWLLNLSVDALNGIARWTGGLPYANLSLSHPQPLEVAVFYLVLGFGAAYVKTRRRKWLLAFLSALVGLLALRLYGRLTGVS